MHCTERLSAEGALTWVACMEAPVLKRPAVRELAGPFDKRRIANLGERLTAERCVQRRGLG